MPKYPGLCLVLCFNLINLAALFQSIYASPTGPLSSETIKFQQLRASETGVPSWRGIHHISRHLQRRWWDVIFGLEEHTESNYLTREALPRYTIIPSELPENEDLGSEKSHESVNVFTPHILATDAPVSTTYKWAPLEPRTILNLNLGTNQSLNLTASGYKTTKTLPHPRFRTLRSISGEWPPARLTDQTYIPFINHNTDFPGHTFTVNGTISVATCGYGGPKHYRTITSEPTSRSFNPAKTESYSYPQQTHEIRSDSAQDTVTLDSTNTQSQTYYDWDNWHSRTFDWDWTDPEIQGEFQSQSSLDVPFVLVPRPLTRPLGGDWREYCYSTLIDRYPSAVLFNMENGVLKDYDEGHWTFRDAYIVEPQGLRIACLQKVPLRCSEDPEAKPENTWSVFAGSWLELAGDLEFWACPNSEEREFIGTGDAGWYLPPMFQSKMLRLR